MIAGVIIAGGEGSRLGMGEKALIRLGKARLIDAVLDIVLPQVDRCALCVFGASSESFREYEERGIQILTDPFPQRIGPLAGLVAGLNWAAALGADWLATFPGDAPFLPSDLVATLKGEAPREATRPVVATDATGLQPLCALWPLSCRQMIDAAMVQGRILSVRDALSLLNAIEARPIPVSSFFNVNTMADLEIARERFKAK